jgi:hypothetical protein
MALNVATLTEAILRITDMRRPDFVGWPMVLTVSGDLNVVATNNLVADNWAEAAFEFFSEISVPPVPPPVHVAAREAFQVAMFNLLGPPPTSPLAPPTAAAALAAGFTAYATTLAVGATPPVAVPPTASLVIPIGPPIADPLPPAANIAAAVLAWTLTGAYGVPPAAPVPPWT